MQQWTLNSITFFKLHISVFLMYHHPSSGAGLENGDRSSDEELNEYGRKLMGRWYKGAVSKDKLRIRGPGVYIINLQSSNQKSYDGASDGTHWTSVLVTPRFFFYFDSFGLPPPQIVIKYTRGRRGYFFSGEVQAQTSELCGYYDLYTMYSILNGDAQIGSDGQLYRRRSNQPFFKDTRSNEKRVRMFARNL